MVWCIYFRYSIILRFAIEMSLIYMWDRYTCTYVCTIQWCFLLPHYTIRCNCLRTDIFFSLHLRLREYFHDIEPHSHQTTTDLTPTQHMRKNILWIPPEGSSSTLALYITFFHLCTHFEITEDNQQCSLVLCKTETYSNLRTTLILSYNREIRRVPLLSSTKQHTYKKQKNNFLTVL